MYFIIWCGLFFALWASVSPTSHSTTREKPSGSDATQPLIITPLIKAGKIKEAQEASEVRTDIFQGVRSYSGFLTVDETYNSNLFFWFFPSVNNYKEAPVVLWLQGGPGTSSLFGLFIENGPFYITKELDLKFRKYTWTEHLSVIYIDNPVGAGFSFTNDGGFCRNQTIVGEHLYQALLQFFQLFPELQENKFFVTGESYAGKYVPAVSYTIHRSNPKAQQKINLEGLAIGNGISDPVHQLNYSQYLYQIGLVDTNTKEKMMAMEEDCASRIRNQQWTEAYHIFDKIVMGALNNATALFKNVSGFTNNFNFLFSEDPNHRHYEKFLQREDVKAAIHVGHIEFNAKRRAIKINLIEDFMQSVSQWISELLSNYRILLYSGQLDIIVAYPLSVNYLRNLDFSASEEYKKAERRSWYVGEELAGYVKTAGNLTEVLVRNSGHMVPTDQPQWALDLITKFILNKNVH